MSIGIVPLLDLAPDAEAHARARIDAIFWETTVTPPTAAADRAAFHDLWLGQYLRHDATLVFVARDETGETGGYLVGTFANLAASPRFASLPYALTFARAVAQYPAHLHINLTGAWRGRQIGGRLIDAFTRRVQAAGVAGCHVVTAADARNVSFYTRQRFREIDRTVSARGKAIVLLGRDVVAKDAAERS